MVERYSKKHVRRPADEADIEWVTVDASGLRVTVARWGKERTFDFSFLCPFASPTLARDIAVAFGQFAARFARRTALGRYEEFARLWKSVTAKIDAPPYAANLRKGELAERWRNEVRIYLVTRYREAVKQTSAKAATQSVALVLDELASSGLLVDVPAVAAPKNLHLKKVARPGLVELAGSKIQPSSGETSELIRHFRSLGIPVEDAEAEEYVSLLVGQLSPEERRDPQKASRAYFRLTEDYLSSLTTSAEAQFLKWRRHYEEGQRTLLNGNGAVLQAYDRGQLNETSLTIFRRLFPADDLTTATANFLVLVKERFGNCVPVARALPRPFRSRVLKLLIALGGRFHLDAMLNLHRDGVAAAAILYIRDTGANVSTCLTLKKDFERPTSEPGVVEFFAVKARSGYRAIYDCLPVNEPGRAISTVNALRATLAMTSSLRCNFPSLGDSLFVYRYFEEPSVADAAFLQHHFRYLLQSSNLPAAWTLSGVRAAVGISHSLGGATTLKSIGRRLHHGERSLAITAGYALRWPVRKSLEIAMAKYQTLLEVGVACSISGALQWLGKSSEEAEALAVEVRNSRLAFLGGVGGSKREAETEAEADCDTGQVLDRADCDVRLVAIDKESLAEVIATNISLRANEARLRSESAERFDELWIELLAFTTVVINTVKRGVFAYIYAEAEKQANEWISKGFDISELRL